MKRTFLVLLLLAAQHLFAQERALIGPWRLGDTREQVTSYAEFGPYSAVPTTGGLETKNGKFLGQTTTVSFVFDVADRLRYIQVFAYEGPSYSKAKDATVSIHNLFTKDYGGASIPNVVTNGSTMIDRRGLELALDRVLDNTSKFAEQLKKIEETVFLTTLDLLPKNQLSDDRVVAQLGYISRYEAFFVLVFLDRKDQPERRSKSLVYVEKR